MAKKFRGLVGFYRWNEPEPGVHEPVIEQRTYRGDILEERQSYARGDSINGKFTVSDKISIVADRYAFDHITEIVYVEHLGQKWEISSIDTAYPRLILHLGGLYHEETEEGNTDGDT
jgi:hypothetical protein